MNPPATVFLGIVQKGELRQEYVCTCDMTPILISHFAAVHYNNTSHSVKIGDVIKDTALRTMQQKPQSLDVYEPYWRFKRGRYGSI